MRRSGTADCLGAWSSSHLPTRTAGRIARYSYGSMLAQKGRSAPEIQALLGQSRLASTQKYINLGESLRAAVESVDGGKKAVTTPIAMPTPEMQEPENMTAVNS